MVSEQDKQLFLESVEQLGGKNQFTSLEDLLENFNLDYNVALRNENFVKASIWNLGNAFSDDYEAFLLEVNPIISSRYLVGALGNPIQRPAALEVLLQYGPSQVTVNPLVGALGNENRRDIVKEILMHYGPSQVTVNPLVGALRDENIRDVVKEILMHYGPSQVTVNPLVGALGNPIQ